MPYRDGQQSWTCVIPVSERSFADRSGLVEIHVTRATSGEDLRRQLDGVRRQVRINAAAVEIGGGVHLSTPLFCGPADLFPDRAFPDPWAGPLPLLHRSSLTAPLLKTEKTHG